MTTIATGEQLRSALAAAFAYDDELSRGYAEWLGQRCIKHRLPADASAAAVQAEEPVDGSGVIGIADGIIQTPLLGRRILAVVITPGANVTAVAANYASYKIASYDANGGTKTTVLLANTQPTANGGTGNLTAFRPLVLSPSTTPAITNSVVPAGGSLSFEELKGGVGVQGGTTTFDIIYEPY